MNLDYMLLRNKDRYSLNLLFNHLVTRCTMFLNIVNILKLQNRLKALHLFLTVFVKVA